MRAQESFSGSNVAAGTYGPYPVTGGKYRFSIVCTGTPSATVEQLMPDGSTYVALFGRPNTATPGTFIGALVTSGSFIDVDIPPGTVEVVIATSTANYFSLSRLPLE